MIKYFMPCRNSVKTDIKDGYYHVYNRGVGKMQIFKDEDDYGVFLSYLKAGLSPPSKNKLSFHKVCVYDRVFQVPDRIPKNFSNRLNLLCYCLMPNHIHLVIKQLEQGAMKEFIQSVFIRYSVYFNKKYCRVGPLFQGRYKAVNIENEAYLLHLSRYIHLNPMKHGGNLIDAKSSYANYLGLKRSSWLNTNIILNYFHTPVLPDFIKTNDYQKFVEGTRNDTEILEGLILE